MSCTTKPVKPPVCVDKIAVGSGTVSTPKLDKIGMDTLREHLPKHDRSLMSAARTNPQGLTAFIAGSVSGSVFRRSRRQD